MNKLFFTMLMAGLISLCSCETENITGNGTTDDDNNQAIYEEEDSDYRWDESNVTIITLSGGSADIDGSGATAEGSQITINAGGNYEISGSLSNGQIRVDAEDENIVRLILNNASVSNTGTSSLLITKSQRTVIILPENTENTFSDGSNYTLTEDGQNAAIYSKSDLSIYGTGLLTVNGNYKDGITSKDGLIIKSGKLQVTAADDGIRGKDYLVIHDGEITINSGGDGLLADNEDSSSYGYINIEDGTFSIKAKGDGIAAKSGVTINGGTFSITSGSSSQSYYSTVSGKGIKGSQYLTISGGDITITAVDDGLHSNNTITIHDGNITISSGDDGIHADESITIDKGNINITQSVEGVEAHYITVNDGEIHVVSSDDGFNATNGRGGESNDGSCIYINGGIISINASRGDGLDSNGNIQMTGGTVIVHGPSSNPEVAMDYNGTFKISGGMLMASGPNSGHMIQSVSSSSTQNAVLVSFRSNTSALFHIEDASGNELVTFKPSRSYYYVVFSSPALVKGSTYTVYTGGTYTSIDNNGYFSGGTYSGGTQRGQFTVSGAISSITVQ